jgi:hypothetical protein
VGGRQGWVQASIAAPGRVVLWLAAGRPCRRRRGWDDTSILRPGVGVLAGGMAHCAAMVLEAEERGSGGVPPVTSWSSLPCRTGGHSGPDLRACCRRPRLMGTRISGGSRCRCPRSRLRGACPTGPRDRLQVWRESPHPYNPGRGPLSGTQDHGRLEPHCRGSTPPSTGVTPWQRQ